MSETEDISADAPDETPPPRELPGDTFRRARESRGMTLADVSHALKFSQRQIEAIEADRFDLLPGGVFVRGFVRSYAKLLKLNEAPLLAMLDARPAEQALPEVRAPENMGVAVDPPGRHATSPLVPAAAVLVLAAIAVGAWHFIGGKGLSSPGPAKPASEAAAASAVPVEAPQVRIEQPAPQAGSGAPETPSSPPPPPSLPPGARQILLEFSDKSWLEIKDATQKIILTGEHPAGTRQVAVGKPPFQLWVGRASAVRVHYEDREIDLRPHSREDVARLTVQ